MTRFQNEPVPFTPESRIEAHNYIAEKRKDKKESKSVPVTGLLSLGATLENSPPSPLPPPSLLPLSPLLLSFPSWPPPPPHSARGPDPPKRQRKLEIDGRMLNVNEGKWVL